MNLYGQNHLQLIGEWGQCGLMHYILLLYYNWIQDGAENGRRVASSGKTLQFFVCFICFFVVLRVRCSVNMYCPYVNCFSFFALSGARS